MKKPSAAAKKPAPRVAARKPATRVVAKQAVAAPRPVPAVKKSAASEPKKAVQKVKLVRDSFTFPEADHELIKRCKKAAVTSGRETKKSEVVRAAIRAFSELSLGQQLAAYEALQTISVGRPKAK